jgi:hypothetical protein
MSKVHFVGLDVHAEMIAVAVAEPGGEVRSVGIIPNRLESMRKLVDKLGSVQYLKVCYKAGVTSHGMANKLIPFPEIHVLGFGPLVGFEVIMSGRF